LISDEDITRANLPLNEAASGLTRSSSASRSLELMVSTSSSIEASSFQTDAKFGAGAVSVLAKDKVAEEPT